MLKILTDNHPTLLQKAGVVKEFDKSLEIFCDELLQTMRAANGAGIAAPQVGLSERILIITDNDGRETVMVNPKMLDHSTDLVTVDEGCLSIPGESCRVTRPSRCVVEFYTPLGIRKERTLDLWESRVFQHEIDHLNGVLMTDRTNTDVC